MRAVLLLLAVLAFPTLAADYPAPKEGSWVVRDFRFHTGEVLPELKLHYTPVGAPSGDLDAALATGGPQHREGLLELLHGAVGRVDRPGAGCGQRVACGEGLGGHGCTSGRGVFGTVVGAVKRGPCPRR